MTNAQGNLLHVWDTATAQCVRTISTELPEVRNEERYIFNRAVLSPNGAFAFNDDRGIALLFDVTTGRTLRQYRNDRTKGVYLEPAPKSRFLALLRRNVATHLPRI